ncbi:MULTISPECIES: hypothetical protein [Pseudomonas]|uniref:hypothetical protein n=1 Tax=Pseudomonas TaxID=286 RepID=UPI000A1DB402|nr:MULTISPECIES: hypothetical protein [Pseudomonas]PNB80732.1 hypothetical protein C1X30_10605 [Pseudomonas sp. FW305-BF6]MCH4899743.1 hypothetical protein [Pseudomonas sp. B707]PNA08043.1 hypothetical protein C1X28_02145 [Pseudomonas sp. FW305-BF15]PNB50264.1 hypothetical protein C1X29_09610 [Pseudomonas sp. GW456-12-10-14-LB2]TEA59723.1 hypothetical protein EIY71_21520 [Pseudomonas sp. CH235]
MTKIEAFNKIHHLIGTPYVETVKAYINELTGFTANGPIQGPDNLRARYRTVDIFICNEGKILSFQIHE